MFNKPRLLTPGPTPLPERVRLALAQDMIHHRKPGFKKILLETETMLQKLFGTEQPVLPLSCSGTGAMTAAVHGLFLPGETVIVVNGGKFGERWSKIAAVRGLKVVEIDVAWGQAVTPAQVEQALREHPEAKGVFMQVCETSTAAQHPVEAIARLTRTREVLLVADGISAVGISPCPMDAWGIDCLLTGSQKGLMVPPGMALMALSARAWKRAESIPVSCFYFNLAGERDNLLKGQGLFTSPVNLIVGLHESLSMLFEEGGLDALYRKQWALTCMVRTGALALDLPRFMEASDKEKADILLRIIGIGTELHTRDLEIKALYDKRTFTGQLAAQKKHFAEELISYPDAPEEPVSASDLIRQQQEILARNGENQRLRQNLAGLEEKARVLADRRTQLEQTLALLVKEQTEVNESLYTARKSAENLQDESTAELEASIRDIEEINQKVRANLEKSRAEDEAARYASDYDKLTEAITRKRADRMALLNGADLPLPELSVEDGALTYKGKHWRDMSGSDQLRVAAAIVRRLNPDCGFVLLDKLEQMDMTTLQEFSAWLETEHLQAIATRVSTGSECQIIIEDGMVKDAETTLPPVTEKPQQKSWTKGAF